MKRHNIAEFCVYFFVYLLLGIYLTTLLLSSFKLLTPSVILSLYFLIGFSLVFTVKKFVRLNLSLNLDRYRYLIIFIALLTLIQGLFSAPNTSDSMVYHLVRVFYWAQNNSVFQSGFYTPHDYMAPLGDYVLLHIYLVFQSTRLFFLSQWIFFVQCILLSGLIARDLKVGKEHISKIQLFAASVPMLVLQSASTQVDIIVTFLFLVSILLAIRIYKSDRLSFWDYFTLVIVIGLGILTKTIFVLWAILPLVIVMLKLINMPLNVTGKLHIIFYFLVVNLLLVAPYLYQNITLYQAPLGYHEINGERYSFFNGSFGIFDLLISVLKNIFLHIPVPFFADQLLRGMETLSLLT